MTGEERDDVSAALYVLTLEAVRAREARQEHELRDRVLRDAVRRLRDRLTRQQLVDASGLPGVEVDKLLLDGIGRLRMPELPALPVPAARS